ncbi:MAG: hypothetical protein Harvfovirus5_34 [Harvfovirus sp.]|uniref:Uncharacterized protein n=1 Tax=Harvfovirus sp. TaxID=2487768 RepID=A0A3G5A0S1_9VIRU|nr:MAG: hypothetical protein Harvfovirus5_34 [Harvfovirus sp.]
MLFVDFDKWPVPGGQGQAHAGSAGPVEPEPEPSLMEIHTASFLACMNAPLSGAFPEDLRDLLEIIRGKMSELSKISRAIALDCERKHWDMLDEDYYQFKAERKMLDADAKEVKCYESQSIADEFDVVSRYPGQKMQQMRYPKNNIKHSVKKRLRATRAPSRRAEAIELRRDRRSKQEAH